MATTAAMKEKYFRRQALYWLVLAGTMSLAWFILWIASSAPTTTSTDGGEQDKSQAVEMPAHIETLGELNKEVPPIDFSILVRDLSAYPTEFKDKHYFKGKKYTVQLMDVSQNEIITNYLDLRPTDRNQFAYFRYLDDNQNPRYILTYGNFNSVELANTAAKTVDFGLTGSIALSVVPMTDYLKIIDDYERGETVRDLSIRQVRQVRLQVTRNEIPVQDTTSTDEELNEGDEQSQEQTMQIQQAGQDAQTVFGVLQLDGKVSKSKTDELKEGRASKNEPKVEESALESKSEQKNESKSVPTPNVNTSQVPGSE
ncbi:hypothetical protein LU276_07080 [Moraxella haemolytica]|uniref:hypothetical protein n=1 Tax=Moraxella haemolytica TaxID=2904119 RepID=UPI0025432EE3|nr:hypothetical protein [Moraxella sp. ZY171148]WII94782.1 hypothetical protein LU276_07080 [Moraxella sp. ZY171148]